MSADPRPPLIALMGPTAAGKTERALALAERWPMQIISVDSALVYRGLDIGSAKPSVELRQRHPHALIDIRDPDQPYSAAEFRADALAALENARRAGRVPLLVGGTGLYFRALFKGLSVLPAADPELRERLAARGRREGWAALHAELAARDPRAAARIHRNDPQRIQRALEVIALTGRPLSAQQAAAPERLPWRVLKLVLAPAERAELHRRIELRLRLMLREGFLDEVEALLARYGDDPALPALRAVGYRQACEHLRGAGDAAWFFERALYATRQLAKRQLTWLRSEYDAIWLDGGHSQAATRLLDRVARHLGRAVPTAPG